MARGGWPGGRLKLLPLIKKHEEAVELDLMDRGIDYRDRFRPGGGESKLTLRRLLLIVDDLPLMGSRFGAARIDMDYYTTDQRLLMDVFHALSGEPHPYKDLRERRLKEAAQEKRRRKVLEASRMRKRILKQRGR